MKISNRLIKNLIKESLKRHLHEVEVMAPLGPLDLGSPEGSNRVKIISPRGSTIRASSMKDLYTPDQPKIRWPNGTTTTPVEEERKVTMIVDDAGPYHLEAYPSFFQDPNYIRPLKGKGAHFYKQIGDKYYVRVSFGKGGLDSSAGASAQAVAGYFLIHLLKLAGYPIPPKTDIFSDKPYKIFTTGTASGSNNIEDCEVHFNLDEDIESTISGNPILKKDAVFTIEAKNTSIKAGPNLDFDLGMSFSDNLLTVRVFLNSPTWFEGVKLKGNTSLAKDEWLKNKGKRYNKLTQGALHSVPTPIRAGDVMALAATHYATTYTQPSKEGYQDVMPKIKGRKLNVETAETAFRRVLAYKLKKSDYLDHANRPFSEYTPADIVAYLQVLHQAIIGSYQVLAYHVDQTKLQGNLPAYLSRKADFYLRDFGDIINNYKNYLTAVNNNAGYVSKPGAGLNAKAVEDQQAKAMAIAHAENWTVTEYGEGMTGKGKSFTTGLKLKQYPENKKFPAGTQVEVIYPWPQAAAGQTIVGIVSNSSPLAMYIGIDYPAPRVFMSGRLGDQTVAVLASDISEISPEEYKAAADVMIGEYNEWKANREEQEKRAAEADAAKEAENNAKIKIAQDYWSKITGYGSLAQKKKLLDDVTYRGFTKKAASRNPDFFSGPNLTPSRKTFLIRLYDYLKSKNKIADISSLIEPEVKIDKDIFVEPPKTMKDESPPDETDTVGETEPSTESVAMIYKAGQRISVPKYIFDYNVSTTDGGTIEADILKITSRGLVVAKAGDKRKVIDPKNVKIDLIKEQKSIQISRSQIRSFIRSIL